MEPSSEWIPRQISTLPNIDNDRFTFEISNSHQLPVTDLDFNVNKPHILISAGKDCAIKLWDTRTPNEPLKEISDHSHWCVI